MTVVSVPDDWYGPGTKAMHQLVTRASQIRWFSVFPSSGDFMSAQALVNYHVELLRATQADVQLPSAPKISIVQASWRSIRQGSWKLDRYEWWARRWNDAAGLAEIRSLRRLRTAVESSPEAQQLLRAPLWPIRNQSNVLGGTFVADSARDQQLRHLLSEDDFQIARALLGNADTRVWDALLWELAVGAKAVEGANPFEPLLQLYELGYLPIGLCNGSYELYVPELTPAEERGFAASLRKRGDTFTSWA